MRTIFFATLLVSASTIAYEILLMRMLSIAQWHHFAYMIISLALLGYGASGTFVAVNKARLVERFEYVYGASAMLCGLSMVACFVIAQRVPFNALAIVWEPGQFFYLSAIYAIFFVPFFFAASCVCLAFTCRKTEISRIYFFDLMGAGLGATCIIAALFALPLQDALLVVASGSILGSIVVYSQLKRRWLVLAPIATLVILLTAVPKQQLEIRLSEYKGLHQAMQVIGTKKLTELSSPLGLLTVVDSPEVPFRQAPGLSFNARSIPPKQLGVFTDGDSLSVITEYDGDPSSHQYLGDVTTALPYQLVDKPSVLILGAGAGYDTLMALHNGARSVDSVELNPQMTALVDTLYADFAGHLYADDRVTLHTAEARGFVARSESQYDIVQIGLLDSFAVAGSGVQALGESYLYTVEALKEYLMHLTPGGILAITRWVKLPPRDNLKLVATAADALRTLGVENPAKQVAMIRSWNTATLLVKNGAFSEQDIAATRDFAKSRSFDTAYYPGMPPNEANRFNTLERPHFYDGIVALLGDKRDEFAARYKFQIEATSDDQPYFFHFFKWRTLPEVLALRDHGGAGLIEWGYLVVIATLIQALVLGSLLILLPLARAPRRWAPGTGLRMGSYFFVLGLAFLFIELAFIQKFILFLSHPLYSVAVVLAGFLIFAGLGSASSVRLAGWCRARRFSPIVVAVSAICLVAMIYLFLFPPIFQSCFGLPDPARAALSIVLIAPLAFFMGIPFPLGLSQVAESAADFIPWAWGINGFASVISTSLATILAVEFGFTVVMLSALVLYISAAMLAYAART